jgi:hypothetical protein
MMMSSEESQSIDKMPEAIRLMFHRSVKKFLKQIPPSDKDWSYQIKDDDEGLAYNLFYFHNPSENSSYIGFMVVARVGCYDAVKKEMLPAENDKVIVFKFKTVDELLCQTKNQS